MRYPVWMFVAVSAVRNGLDIAWCANGAAFMGVVCTTSPSADQLAVLSV